MKSTDDESNKRINQQQPNEEESESESTQQISNEAESVLLDDNLLYEILRHVDDGRTLATAACVSRQWRRTAHDDRIWELICTKHYPQSSSIQLRAVVLALGGGFRRLYSSRLWPLLKPAQSSRLRLHRLGAALRLRRRGLMIERGED